MGTDDAKHSCLPKITAGSCKTFLTVNLGVLLLSVGVYFFKFPNNFTTGGVSGLSMLISSFFPTLTPATLMAAINMALLVVGFIFLSRGFGFWTVYCSLMFSFETWLLEKIYPMAAPFTDQPLLELCFAIMLPAVGSALLFNGHWEGAVCQRQPDCPVVLLGVWHEGRAVLFAGPVHESLCGGFCD